MSRVRECATVGSRQRLIQQLSSRALTPGRADTPPTRRRLHGVGARAARNSAVTGQAASPGPERGVSLRPAHFSGPLPNRACGFYRTRLFTSPSVHPLVQGGGGEHFGPQPWLQQLARAGRSAIAARQLQQPSKDARLNPDRAAATNASPVVPGCCRTYTGNGKPRRTPGTLIRRSWRCCITGTYAPAAFSSHQRWRNSHWLHRTIIERLDAGHRQSGN